MVKIKECKQCGDSRPLNMFRKYYNGRTGRYNTCKVCERINSREKYLTKKIEINEDEKNELEKIHTLWEYQRTLGLRPPERSSGKKTPIGEDLDGMLRKYDTRVADLLSSTDGEVLEGPQELLQWLTIELTEDPDYYQDVVYEELVEKFRPIIGVGEDHLPIHDDTHRALLQRIATRFDDYEDGYYE